MGNPRIGRKVYDPPVETLEPASPAPDKSPTPEPATVHDFVELVEPVGVGPNPPKCILKKLKSRDLVWRWLSEPAMKRLGMRMYELWSVDDKDRALINSGRDAAPGVRVSAENTVRWLDDAFLGVIPRRYFLQRQAMKQARVLDQTKRSKELGGLKEAAGRAGARITDFEIKSWSADELEDREPS